MQRIPFGNSGLSVTPLGFGAGEIGDARLDDAEVARLLDAALELGIGLIDTARGYGLSEERIGRHLAGRRREFVLSSKGGYGIEGVPDWTADVITRGVDAALERLRTDCIDVFFLHSCPREVLVRGDVVGALIAARQAGKVRVAGYSGENDALDWAVDSGHFGAIQCSVNLCDQRSIDGPIARAAARGLGVVAKRPLANAPWRFDERPDGNYCEVYWDRLRAMGWGELRGEHDWVEAALRFAAFAPGVSSAIVGTTKRANLEAAARVVGRGPLPESDVARMRAAFRAHDEGWVGQI
jgi:aryl-alcohol dehydrogenase-like predicted oxidoreductase